MMIVTAWLVHCLLISAVLSLGAMAWELSARWSGRSARWAWLGALAGSVTLPWLLRLVPERAWPEVVPTVVSAALSPVALPPVTSAAFTSAELEAAASQWSAVDIAVAGWLLLSLLVVGYVARVVWAVSRARARWRETRVDGARVFVTRNMGPAALGVREGMIILPSWALELEEGVRSLLLLHEREHVRAGDPRLVFGGLLLLAAVPWNPFVWLQVIRLRNAIELDCDARVLARGVHPRAYGALLLEVGRRRSGSPLVMATFAEPRLFLEERIRRIAQWPLERRRGRAAAFAVAALALFTTALSARDPLRQQLLPPPAVDTTASAGSAVQAADQAADTATPAETSESAAHRTGDDHVFVVTTSEAATLAARAARQNRQPELLNTAEVFQALLTGYPPLLRDAGIGGIATIWFYVGTDGLVQRTQVASSSGQRALDEHALSVASLMRFRAHVKDGQPAPVWVEIAFVFGPEQRLPQPSARGEVIQLPALIVVPPEMYRPARTPSPQRIPDPPTPPAGDISQAPTFTPMTERPQLDNALDVQRLLIQNYPPVLRDAGIGGTPVIWFFIDDSGRVLRTQLSRSSGYPALDDAALTVARQMRFTPAMNRDRKVSVWVEIPIVFSAR